MRRGDPSHGDFFCNVEVRRGDPSHGDFFCNVEVEGGTLLTVTFFVMLK